MCDSSEGRAALCSHIQKLVYVSSLLSGSGVVNVAPSVLCFGFIERLRRRQCSAVGSVLGVL